MCATRVNICLYGERHVFTMARDGSTVLEASREAGLSLPSSCEAGACASCRARLLSGSVTHRNNFALDDDDLAAGYVLSCQSVPVSDEISLDFDA